MRHKPLPPVLLTAHQECKIESMREFIALHLPPFSNAGTPARLALLAKSPDSPIARAIIEIAGEIAARGGKVQAVFHQLDGAAAADWMQIASSAEFERDIRWARNPAFADAHEQLIVGRNAAWVGDCMRRDLWRRDSLEQRFVGEATAIANLEKCFSRLWSKGELIGRRQAAAQLSASADTLSAIAAAEDALGYSKLHDEDNGPDSLTRQ